MDLWVAVSDESNIENKVVDARLAAGSVVRSITRSALGIVAARAPAIADAIWHYELAGRNSQDGTIGHYEHAIRDGQSTGVKLRVSDSLSDLSLDLQLSQAPLGIMSLPSALLHLLTSRLLVYDACDCQTICNAGSLTGQAIVRTF